MSIHDRITEIMLLIPSRDDLASATDDQLEEFRKVSNLIANAAYLERWRREKELSASVENATK